MSVCENDVVFMLMRIDVANVSSTALADDRIAVAQRSTLTRWRDWWSGSYDVA